MSTRPPWELYASPTPEASSRPPWESFQPAATPATAEPQGSALSRFGSGVWQNVNPVTIAQGLYGAVRHPIDTGTAAVGAMQDQWSRAYEAGSQGNYVEAAGHGLAGSIPFVGPAAAAAGERIGEGDVAGGLGEGVGLLIPTMAPRAVQAGVRGVRSAAPGLAGRLEAGAAAKVADVISPKVGAHKTRFANNAADVAPALVKDLASDGAPLTRGGYHSQVQTRLAAAQQGLDAAMDARLGGQSFKAAEIIKDLYKKREAMTSKAIDSGKDVVPAPNRARVAAIDQAIAEIEELRGSVTGAGTVSYEPIRVMRQAYDGQAKVVYNPSMTADFLKQKGSALGASDVTAVLREHLAKWDPETAKANAQYSLYRTADDILRATAEVERARPKVGRQIIARMTGTILGNQTAGVGGAVAGYVAGPILDSALASGVTTQLKTAALMQRLATAIERGDVGRVASITHDLQRLGVTASATAGQQRPTDAAPTYPWQIPAPGTR